MSEQTITLAGATRGLRNLYDAYEFGQSAERPGLVDTVRRTEHHMGEMLEQVRSLHASQVEELRARNRADAEPEERPVGSEETST